MSEEYTDSVGRRKPWETSVLYAAIGIGIFYFVVKQRYNIRQCFHKLKHFTSPLGNYKIIIADTPAQCQDLVSYFRSQSTVYPVLGFDCEWTSVNDTRHPVALLQLASKNGICALIRLCKLKHVPVGLQELLEDSSILKVGVAPYDDAKYLCRDYKVSVNGCLDLRHLVVESKGSAKGGLAGLSERIINVKLDKNWRIRCSDWEAETLSEQQCNYAARDALVAVKIFDALISRQLKYPSVYKKWLFGSKVDVDIKTDIDNLCDGLIDMKFKSKFGNISGKDAGRQQSPNGSLRQRSSLKPITRSYSTRQSPLYHNCYMQAPDGAVLCTCDRRKAIWYVSKGLAELISEDPVTVRLNFEPSGRATGEVGKYYTQEKVNCCVVCGKMNMCLRKNVVPHEYRKHFPKVMKDHVSHDVLLMCLNCHQMSNHCDMTLRFELAEECNAPFSSHDNLKCFENRSLKSIQMAAKALLREDPKIPEERQEELKSIVQSYFENEELTKDLLLKAATLQTSIPNKDYVSHGPKVVEYYSLEGNGGLVKLEQMWREHFLKTMKPKYLPNLWSVTHTQDRLAIRAAEKRILPNELEIAGMKECVNLLDLASSEAKDSMKSVL